MNIYTIKDYVDKLRKKDVVLYALKGGIILNNEEADNIYNYLKKDYQKIIYQPPSKTLKELQSKLTNQNYNKLEAIYQIYQIKINNFIKTIKEGS